MYGAILLTALVGSAAATTHTNKTFLSPRPHGVNTAMEYTTWNQHPYKKHAPNIRSFIQATAFYQESQNGTGLGKYFGIGNGSNSFTVGDTAPIAPATATDINAGYLIHDSANALHPQVGGTVTFDPKQEVFGIRLDYFQDITHPFDKLFFRASAPLVDVETNVHMNIANQTKSATAALANYTLTDFFAGNVNVTASQDNTNVQSSLTHGKIIGRRTELGIGDLDLGLGYKYLDTAKKHVFFSLDVTVPTGSKIRSLYLFEPAYGNGLHVGLGGSIDAGIDLWHSEKALLKLLGVVHYKYLFENTEHRIIPLKGYKLSQYYLVGKLGTPANADQPLVPLANVANTTCVKPGSQLDGMLDFVFNCCKFTIDLGYNMYWRDQESVWLKNLVDNVYAVALPSYSTHTAIAGETVVNVNHDTLDINAAKTPTLFSHKLFAGLGYSFNFYKQYTSSFGVGGSYEFATSNADLENYALWAKMMFSF
jgi:hypothetical protein